MVEIKKMIGGTGSGMRLRFNEPNTNLSWRVDEADVVLTPSYKRDGERYFVEDIVQERCPTSIMDANQTYVDYFKMFHSIRWLNCVLKL